ncbi:MAG: PIN domain nuclease [Planctomycetes bacterium]|jgi:hypothetical protein|nr:PIN domain nuclease [Planctomycetota bacterium]
MILVDTSVWIDFFRGTDSPEADLLARAIAGDEDLAICGLILMEILQGIGDGDQARRTRNALAPLLFLPLPHRAWVLAADLYRAARAGGKTVRNSVDCLVAACAILHGAALLQKDRDFRAIASVSNLRLL